MNYSAQTPIFTGILIVLVARRMIVTKGSVYYRMITTLEDRRLREGDRVVISLGSGEVEVEVIDAGDPAKLKVKLLDTGSEVWIGRRCIVDLVNED